MFIILGFQYYPSVYSITCFYLLSREYILLNPFPLRLFGWNSTWPFTSILLVLIRNKNLQSPVLIVFLCLCFKINSCCRLFGICLLLTLSTLYVWPWISDGLMSVKLCLYLIIEVFMDFVFLFYLDYFVDYLPASLEGPHLPFSSLSFEILFFDFSLFVQSFSWSFLIHFQV